LRSFQEFYGSGSLKDFLDRVEADQRLPRDLRKRVARNTIRDFVSWLQKKGYAPKTIRAYVASVQSMAKYFDIPLSTRYTNLPSALPVSKKEPWTIERITAFIDSLKMPHRAVAAIILQNDLSLSDVLALGYGDIRHELEAGTVPLCLDLTRIKTDVPFMTFIGKWAVSLLKRHLKGVVLEDEDKLFKVSQREIEQHFKRVAKSIVEDYKGFNPARPHSLRAAFKTFLTTTKLTHCSPNFGWTIGLPSSRGFMLASPGKDGDRHTASKLSLG